jgi:hypothetical protein
MVLVLVKSAGVTGRLPVVHQRASPVLIARLKLIQLKNDKGFDG